MITGSLKNKINSIWQDFYNENMAQTSEIVNQLTTLMFIKMLDDKQNAVEAQAAILGIEPKENELTFKKGEYVYKEIINGQEQVRFRIPYEELRWKNFKNLNSSDLADRIKNYVIPFIKDPHNKAIGKFGEYAKKYTFGFDDKERLLTSVVDKLSDEELNFTNTDLMGDVYEYICGSGVSGQFRTPRHIIDMAVDMMKPRLGEKIIDPAMGTAGFIVEAAKYIQTHQADELMNVENKRLFNNEMFYGCDNDTNMSRIGYMNCILHNIKDPHITIDSLLEHENAKDYLNEFDLVLQNPPFSGSLVESATNGKILAITKTKKTELLFVALMLSLMKVGGRGMSIVPDGVLFGGDNAHLNLRKELIDKQRLIGIVSMPYGLFSAPTKKGSASKGAGVKTSFLIFQKTNNGGTDYVWFYDMQNDGYTLDAKRTPIEGSDIPDIIERFNNLEVEKNRIRKDQSFMVPVSEIREKGYDLTLKAYKEIQREEVKYRKSSVIAHEIKELARELMTEADNLDELLGD
ncbi:MAG: type I restriction-modification system subunit M [Acetatifactor sp.]|nr:type I restriction-modification system subunit M [Acetatifactor sp.]